MSTTGLNFDREVPFVYVSMDQQIVFNLLNIETRVFSTPTIKFELSIFTFKII